MVKGKTVMWHEVCEVFKDDTEFYPAGNICEDLKETNYKWFSLLKNVLNYVKENFL